MTPFLSEDFLLHSQTAKTLYHDYAAAMPIYDYHCHLPVKDIAANRKFENLTQIWLYGDHYKWRAMRANGIAERYITGDASDWEKFQAWAETVPKTLRNPLYHWTHLELKRYFSISDTLLDSSTAKQIYDACNEQLQSEEFSTRGILQKMNVKVVCTTDDPLDNLEHHKKLQGLGDFPVRVLPAFRPDMALAVEKPAAFNTWVDRLQALAQSQVVDYQDFLNALGQRYDYFQAAGCRLSDHGIEEPYAENVVLPEIRRIFEKIRNHEILPLSEIRRFKSAMLLELGRMNADRNWTQQFHMGALRNTNTRAFEKLGPDTGYDTIGDFAIAGALVQFMDTLESEGKLTRTILYNLNPNDNEVIAAMIGNFQDGNTPGKIQFGSGWWFNDQKEGMQRQINALSNMGLLSLFVGMLTDSRSFLSYPRHEYFRRVLCNLLGTDAENGELPDDIELLGSMVQDICWNNAVRYFGIEVPE